MRILQLLQDFFLEPVVSDGVSANRSAFSHESTFNTPENTVLVGSLAVVSDGFLYDVESQAGSNTFFLPPIHALDMRAACGESTGQAREGKEQGRLAYTNVMTPSGPYRILSRIRLADHPMIARSLAISDPFRNQNPTSLRKVRIGKGAYGTVRFAESDAHSLCVVKKTDYKSGLKELHSLKLLQRIPESDQHLFVKTFDGVQAVGKKGEMNTYLFQEYMSGGDLSSKVKSSRLRAFNLNETSAQYSVAAAKALCAPVAALHRVGLFHRDIKPANYLIDNGQVKLADFGFLTDTQYPQKACGTPSFMPPEVFEPQDDEHYRADQSDAFALGVMLYQLAGGVQHPMFAFGQRSIADLAESKAFVDSCDAALEHNMHDPSLKSIALHLLHPESVCRLSVIEAESLLSTL